MTLLIAALATYRVARALTRERGPFEVFTRLQNIGEPGGWLHDGLNCPLCVGFWVSLVVGLLVYAGLAWLLTPLAVWGLSTLFSLREMR